ncbi:MAG TPA: Smr/MutS family protein [Myxococcales bacterium]|nr:Smr/MutS family protein [Myxococcales bacterium]
MLDAQALSDLGFDLLLAALAERARTPEGRARCAALPLLRDRPEVELHLAQVEEGRARLRSADSPPLGDFGDVGAQLQRAEKHGLLEGQALLEVASFARASSRLRGYLEDRATQLPLLAAEAEALADLPALVSRIEAALEPGGRVADRASAALGQLRERVRQLHRELKERLEQLLADDRFRHGLREGYVTIRNERYCVPVQAQFRADIPGIVHNASESGQTLFVEPQPLIGLGNELAIAQSMAAEEEQRILLELTAEIGRASRDLRQSMAAVAKIDELFAGAALAEALSANRPEVVEAREPFAFEALRHPLLVLQKQAAGQAADVVASDVLLTGRARALVVSGPNAGGKTITLSGVGLCVVMVRAGLPIPAGPLSRVPLVNRLSTAIGDAQDLSRGLSTFTAHLAALRRILDGAGPGSLALIDEMAADTDPREGAALAVAVLEELIERGALVVATTHLEPLKALALGDPRFANAAVGFDPLALAPTYRLTLGLPGQSSALEVARRSGVPQVVLDRAHAHLSGQAGPLGAALAALEDERRRLAQVRADLEVERAAAAREREAAAARAEALDRREAELAAGARRELVAELERERDRVREIVAALQRRPEAAAASQATAELGRAIEAQQSAADAPARDAPSSGVRAVAGQRVRSRSLAKEGELLAVEGESGLVAFGAIKLRQPLGDLVPVDRKRPPAGRQEVARRASRAAGGAIEHTEVRCDLRGLRAEDAVREAERFLDRAYGEGAEEVLLVHGLGSGALRATLRTFLSGSSYVRAFHPAETHRGGEGTTVVELTGE